nr:violaxanthin de-epoxidase, chloroplastic [Tanacetum cinerariifolium]
MSFFTCLPYNNNNNPTTTTLCSVSSSSSVLNNDDDDVRIVAIVGEGAISPLKSASWTNVLLHTPYDKLCDRCGDNTILIDVNKPGQGSHFPATCVEFGLS